MEKYILKDMIVGEILEGNYDTIKKEINKRKNYYKTKGHSYSFRFGGVKLNTVIKKEKNVYILKESGE